MIPYEDLHRLNEPFAAELRTAFAEALHEGTFILGRQVREFESEFATYCGVAHCVGVGNGLDALTLALRCFGFKAGSEVIVPSNTYIATILAIINSGLKPVLVEPDISTYNIDPNLLEDSITPRTVAIMVVHLYGKCCPMDEILAIREKHGLKLIEDCAHAHGAKYKGRMAGTFGDFGAFSFYPTKNLGALGDGGGLITSDKELANRIRALRSYGALVKDKHNVVGYNSRLDEIQAAFLRVKLRHLDELNRVRRSHVDIYRNRLSEQFLRSPGDEGAEEVHHIFPIRHPKREALREHLLLRGVESLVHYPIPPHQQKALRNFFSNFSFPTSEEIHSTILSIPVSPIHTNDDIRKVVEVMNSY